MGCDYYISLYITLLLSNNDNIKLLYNKSRWYFTYMSDSDEEDNIENIQQSYYNKNNKILMSNDKWIKQQYKDVYYDFIINNINNGYTETDNIYQYLKIIK